MIAVKDLTKYYGSFAAIQTLNFEVADGEIVGFLGPNAAGKTTTLKILAGYMPPTSGIATVHGYDCVTQSLAARKSLGYLPETVPLYPGPDRYPVFGFRRPRPKDWITASGAWRWIGPSTIAPWKRSRIPWSALLSKGFRQRVGLAQALLGRPPLLILDEPTIGLDPAQIVEIRELIRQLAGDHTVILSSHILPEVSQLCQRVIIINRGQIVASDTPANLTHQLNRDARVHLMVKGPVPEVQAALQAVPGVKNRPRPGKWDFYPGGRPGFRGPSRTGPLHCAARLGPAGAEDPGIHPGRCLYQSGNRRGTGVVTYPLTLTLSPKGARG